jgi:hypothetical protein
MDFRKVFNWLRFSNRCFLLILKVANYAKTAKNAAETLRSAYLKYG